MAHLPHFITDLALILGVAGITTLLFRKIRQPVVLGYLIAGFLVGPHFSLTPTVVDSEGVKLWSEIGVIFLLFSLGLDFSFKKLLKVGGSASITAIVEVLLMIGFGFLAGRLFGWSIMDSIFLGAILSVSSTTIIIRAFDEAGVRTKKFATLVFGILIVEDLVAVLLLVLLSTLAVSHQFAGAELLTQIFKLSFFLILWFLGGIYFIPTFLKRMRKLMNDETLLIVSIALCLLMVIVAVKVGFSPALGAFIMGSILAETTYAEHIEHLIKSVKDLFAAIFFVSVGMMIDPLVLNEYAMPVVAITLITIFGKLFSTVFGALLSGQSLKHSVQAGMSLAQIGEFSFIIAALGTTLNVTSSFLYPIAVAASAITTFTTPFFIQQAGNFYGRIENALPAKWINTLNRYSRSSQQLSAYSEWKDLLKSYFINSLIHSVLILGIIYFSGKILHPLLSDIFNTNLVARIATIVLTLLFIIPFIWAFAIRRINKEAYSHLWLNRTHNRGPLIVIELARIALAVFHVGVLIYQFFPIAVAFVIAVVFMAVAILVFSKNLQRFYDRIEMRFFQNFHERDFQKAFKKEIVPWDAHIADFDVPSECPFAGKQLHQLALREKYGVNVALIDRGKLSIIVPDRHERLYPGDKVSILGTDDQLAKVKVLFDVPAKDLYASEIHSDQIVLRNFTVSRHSFLFKKSIHAAAIRQKAKALVVGIERNGDRILNPESKMILEDGDIVWVVGLQADIEDYIRAVGNPTPSAT